MAIFDASRLGFSNACFANTSLARAAELGAATGFRCIELLAFDGYRHSQGTLAGFYFEHMTGAERDALRQLASHFEHISTHAPFIDMAPLAPNPSIRETARRQLEIAVESAAFLGASTTTTHVAPKAGCELPEFLDELKDLYRRLGDQAAAAGVTVTIETGYPVPVEQFAELIWGIDHPAVGANVDVGHLRGTIPRELHGTPEGAALYNDALEAHVRSLGAKLYHFHLHDINPQTFRDHRAAGRGFLDYPRLLRTAAEIGYRGLLVFELEEPDMEQALADSRATILAAMEG
jgi:sugar phosphate isomerase/epimerase